MFFSTYQVLQYLAGMRIPAAPLNVYLGQGKRAHHGRWWSILLLATDDGALL